MARIYRVSDKLPVKIDDLEIKISPLSFAQRSEIQSILSVASKTQDFAKASEGTFLAVKYSLKEVSGIENYDGTKYELEKDDQGILTDDCVSNLLNLESSAKICATTIKLINGVPDSVLDDKGVPVEGITLLYKGNPKSPNPKTKK